MASRGSCVTAGSGHFLLQIIARRGTGDTARPLHTSRSPPGRRYCSSLWCQGECTKLSCTAKCALCLVKEWALATGKLVLCVLLLVIFQVLCVPLSVLEALPLSPDLIETWCLLCLTLSCERPEDSTGCRVLWFQLSASTLSSFYIVLKNFFKSLFYWVETETEEIQRGWEDSERESDTCRPASPFHFISSLCSLVFFWCDLTFTCHLCF